LEKETPPIKIEAHDRRIKTEDKKIPARQGFPEIFREK